MAKYPHLPNYAKVIDNYMTYAQSAIDEFSDSKNMPQIAISVDMLDSSVNLWRHVDDKRRGCTAYFAG